MTTVPTWNTVAATGHRPQHLTARERDWVRRELARVVRKLRDEHGMRAGISGMAIGADQWWAAELVDAGTALHAHVPFPQQADRWQQADRDEWRRLLGLAATVTYYGDHYDVKLLHARNAGMLAACEAVVAVHKSSKTSGGTASAVRSARQRRLPIVLLNPESMAVTLANARTALSLTAEEATR